MTVYVKVAVDGVVYTPGVDYLGVELFTFPGGERHLKYPPVEGERVRWIVDVRGADANDLIAAGMVSNMAVWENQESVLLLPYLPAARADKGVPVGADVYAGLINSMWWDAVVTVDPHSDYMVDVVDNLRVMPFEPMMLRALDLVGQKFDAVIAPDKGATERAARAADALGVDLYQADKTRDFDTGRLTGYTAPKGLPRLGRYLVVDDICDGGGTFELLASHLDLARERLSLWVTHGIFSGKPYSLRQYYQHIVTTDSHPGSRKLGHATVITPVGLPLTAYAINNL